MFCEAYIYREREREREIERERERDLASAYIPARQLTGLFAGIQRVYSSGPGGHGGYELILADVRRNGSCL